MTTYIRIHLAILFLGASIGLTGCNAARITLNTPLTQEDVAFIIPGQTTSAQIIGKLGAPDALTESVTGVVATYRFLDMTYSRVNFGWLFKYWSPADPDLIISRTGFGTDALEVMYDTKGIVTQHTFHRHLDAPRFNPYPF